MNVKTTTIRELRTNFRAVKRSIEQHGEVVVTDRGEPAYLLKALPPPPGKTRASPPDYYARLRRRQPNPLSAEATRRFWEDERR